VNLQDYIESGILEAYILGSLTHDEELLVEANIAKFPELGDELLALEKAMEQYSANLASNPPAGLEDKIWNSIQTITDNSEGRPVRTPKIVNFKPGPPKTIQWKYAAVWVALIGSMVVNMLLYKEGDKLRDDKLALHEQMDQLQSEKGKQAVMIGYFQKEKTMMADTAMQTIVMHTTQKGHPMVATLYWSKDKGEAYITADALPPPPKGMQYQLWALQGGKPVDMGVLPIGLSNTPVMQKVGRPITRSDAFAISLEKEGGSPTPTMENIYVLGKV
jgi:hypothetical protein